MTLSGAWCDWLSHVAPDVYTEESSLRLRFALFMFHSLKSPNISALLRYSIPSTSFQSPVRSIWSRCWGYLARSRALSPRGKRWSLSGYNSEFSWHSPCRMGPQWPRAWWRCSTTGSRPSCSWAAASWSLLSTGLVTGTASPVSWRATATPGPFPPR